MPHIHTQPNQHDMTVSAYIIMQENNEWMCLVHMHKKIGKLMQVGGHIELDETPWQAVMHEVEEESGYTFEELDVLQGLADTPREAGNVIHPTPLAMNTHSVGDDHYHSDLCYGFVARSKPNSSSADGESNDFRWLTIKELHELAKTGVLLQSVVHMYDFLVDHEAEYSRLPATKFSTSKPKYIGDFSYKTGSAAQQR